jgi:Ca2+-binding RTX toxin-like protein
LPAPRGNDTLSGTAAAMTSLDGLGGNDSLLSGMGGNDSAAGRRRRSDTLAGGGGNDTLDGGTITDTVNYTDLNVAWHTAASTSGCERQPADRHGQRRLWRN